MCAQPQGAGIKSAMRLRQCEQLEQGRQEPDGWCSAPQERRRGQTACGGAALCTARERLRRPDVQQRLGGSPQKDEPVSVLVSCGSVGLEPEVQAQAPEVGAKYCQIACACAPASHVQRLARPDIRCACICMEKSSGPQAG